ncbi:Uncharacterised protein [Nocardia farcinica]|uniref:Uncharacterized protein n=1 Tax=Nocardia farcinica TaxID=37329 RepID=A0A449GM10_NOCFR|nr:Uncharacterised protein [Nocardia farcinica]
MSDLAERQTETTRHHRQRHDLLRQLQRADGLLPGQRAAVQIGTTHRPHPTERARCGVASPHIADVETWIATRIAPFGPRRTSTKHTRE